MTAAHDNAAEGRGELLEAIGRHPPKVPRAEMIGI